MEREEIMWKQRSRVAWLKDGDRNTKFFHPKSSNHQRRNRITPLKDNEGAWIERDQLYEHIVSYFINLFSANSEHRSMDFLSTLERRVIDNMCLELDNDFSAEEIQIALRQMHLTKAPSLDVTPPIFY